MKNLILVGFMGAGKTYVGKLLSRRLCMPMVDIDQQIEKKAGFSIVDIFRHRGEEYFRRLEKSIITHECSSSGKIISLGGGAFLDPDNRRICLSGQNKVIFLNTSWNYVQQRLEILKQSRPLLQNKSEEQIRAMFEERQKTYKLAHLEVFVEDFKTHNEVAAYITNLLITENEPGPSTATICI